MDFYIIITEGINAFLNLYLAYYLLSTFCSYKYSMKINILVFFLLGSLYTIPLLFAKGSLINYVSIFSITVILSGLFDSKITSRIIYTSIFFGISAATEMIVGMTITQVFDVEIAVAKQGVLYIMGMLLSKFATFIIITFVRLKRHFPAIYITRKKNWSILAFPFATFSIILLQHGIFVYTNVQNAIISLAVLICYTLLIVSNILIFEYIDNLYKNTLNESKLVAAEEIIANQFNQYQALIEHQHDIMKIKHDHRNFCIGLLSELNSGNISHAISIIEKECKLIIQDKNSPRDIIHTVVNIKNEFAQKFNISINFEYHELKKLVISAIDMAIILGNALDNAIEATKEINNENAKRIELFVALNNDNIIMTIKNPTIKNINTNTLYTNKKNPQAHGFGIISMKHIAAKYAGEIIFSCENCLFTTSIIMNNITPINND